MEGRRDPHAAPPARCRRAPAAEGSCPADVARALLALLAGTLPIDRLAAVRLIVTPGTILRWHRDIVRRRWSRRSRRALKQAAPLRQLPDGITDLDQFRVQRRDRAGGVIHEYRLVA